MFGRGDSAVLQLGIPPATTAELERGLTELQGFLGGEDVELEGGARAHMSWIGTTHASKVPVSVAATGPRTIAETCAGRLRALLALGLERIVMVPGSRDADLALVAESNERFAGEVLPALRG